MRQLAEHLVARGHRVTVATSRLDERKSLKINGVDIVEFDVSGNIARGMTGEVAAYREYLLNSNCDVFMVKAAQQWTFDAALPVLGQMRIPKVFVPCGFAGLYEPAYAEYYRSMPEALRRFERLIFYASDYRDINFTREHGLSRISIVPNGADEHEFNVPADPGFRRRQGIDEAAFVILTVGTLTGGKKGHRELALAYAQASFPATPAVLFLNGNQLPRRLSRRFFDQIRALVFHSNRDDLPRIAKLAAREILLRAKLDWLLRLLGIRIEPPLEALVTRINRAAADKRAILADLPRAELVQAYLNSDLFVFASNIEYSPLVLYEAAAAGLPFLSVPVGNAEEIAHWTGGGEICPADQDGRGYTQVDPAVLAKHIERLAADPGRLAALGEAGRRNWSRKYTWEKITDMYENIFQSLIEEGKNA